MSQFEPIPKPTTPLGYHRILSPTAAVKVSPICIGGISFGESWSASFGKCEPADVLLDAFFDQGGNFIDTSNTYNAGESEELLGKWMEERDNRDQMVVATKYTAGYLKHELATKPLQTNYAGNSAKSMHVSVRDSLRKLRTDYIDILYVHWWDFATSVEEVMTHLHKYVMSNQVLYLGVSDTPAWVVVKDNACAREKGLTPFSVYQGRWNAAYRDMESEIIPMCEDQGMAIVSWASLGGGQLLSSEQRRKQKEDPNARPASYGIDEGDEAVCDAIEKIANEKKVPFQAIALAYLFAQSTYVCPIVGVQTVDHVKSMNDALRISLSPEEVSSIHKAKTFNPPFPMSFLFDYGGGGNKPYSTKVTAADTVQYQMWAHIDAPPKQGSYVPHSEL